MPEHHAGLPGTGPLLIGLALTVLLGAYTVAVAAANRRGRRWPRRRTAAWCAGLAVVAAAALGPLGTAAHHHFTAHLAAHLLVGMLAPLLLVAGAPVTVLLRALPVSGARRLSRVLGSQLVRGLSHPVTAAVLNAGGLWLLYTTALYEAMGAHPGVHVAVHAHMLLTGYLLIAALVGSDPAPHRCGFATRAAVLVAFAAAHGILAKYLYGHPAGGVPADQAAAGAMLMYYGGDLIDVALMVRLGRRWYAARHPRLGVPGPTALTLTNRTA